MRRSKTHRSFDQGSKRIGKKSIGLLALRSGNLGRNGGAYRLLDNPDVTYEQILSPHWAMTYHEATQCSRTLLLADTTEMDFSTYKAVKG